jgi:putative membrane protein insertion efficiency factor
MAKINTFLASFLIVLIRGYRFAISALLGHCCRFEPSCSAYAIQAIQSYGLVKGCGLTLRRVMRCHPWCPGGIDPVP